MHLSILTPTTRPEGLPMLADCLFRQSHQDWEWLISAPTEKAEQIKIKDSRVRVLIDPPPAPGDFYVLNKAWNALIAEARSDALVFTVDWTYFATDTLDRFLLEWDTDIADGALGRRSVGAKNHHFRITPKSGVGRPEIFHSNDPRVVEMARSGLVGNRLRPDYWELSLALMPKQAILAAGGFDPEFDQGAGCSEKDLAVRMAAQGHEFYLNPEIECRNYTHPKASTPAQWDAAYDKARLRMLQLHPHLPH